MSTAMPQIPPRPTRSQDQTNSNGSTLGSDNPRIPPRPINRRLDRSASPHRFATSPLNEFPPSLTHPGNHSKSSLYASESANASGSEIRRPPSVNLPSIGQEGNEYAEVFGSSDELGTSPTQTRNIANDLKLHAPKPSLPTSSAKQRVSAVTRTDSGQAAAYGIGKASKASSSADDKNPDSRDLKSKPSFASQNSSGTERRPSSVSDSEHGIPQIGQIVPMYPNAGDVQAPSPAPFAVISSKGVGFHNDGTKPKHHSRKLSGRDIPPDAYGRYGHGVIPHDRFEKQYYEKHPELFKKELAQYGEGRPEWAMSSDDLNKIVRDTASRGPGFGTPSEQIGFQASEEYASRMSSPRPGAGFGISHSNASDTHVDSPLRKKSTVEDSEKAKFEKTLSKSLKESESEEEDTIHVDTPAQRTGTIYGGYGHAESTEDLGPHTGQGGEADGIHDEHSYGAPILASDEVAKEPFGWELQPAVSPVNERHSGLYEDHHHRSGSQTSSRPSSRPGSIHGVMPDYQSPRSAPLEDLDEYEPLFPEEEKKPAGVQKPMNAADKLKRPSNRKFPSQDVWEDSPNSLQYTATVSTPQLPEDEEGKRDAERVETPAQAFARRQEELAEQESKSSNQSFLRQEKDKKPWAKPAHLVSETRPGMKQRFPSRDIWEDTPDSLQLQTTVTGPQVDEKDVMSPPEDRPTTGAVAFHQEKAAAGYQLGSEEGRATTGIAATMKPSIPSRPTKSKLSSSPEKPQPSIPARPSRTKEISPVEGSPPSIPTKAKPQIPARPSKPISRESSENVPLTQVPSNTSDSSAAAAAKSKPPVPSRPMGSKIAALQGGFMSDLNKRLQLGPQAPKKDEPATEEVEEEKEKAPLVDARKGRARGPARRAPAKSPAPATVAGGESEKSASTPSLGFSMCSTLWSIDPEADTLEVLSHEEEAPSPVVTKSVEKETPTLATNSAGEELDVAQKEKDFAPTSAVGEKHAEAPGKVDTPVIPASEPEAEAEEEESEGKESGTSLAVPETEEEDLSASMATLKPASSTENGPVE